MNAIKTPADYAAALAPDSPEEEEVAILADLVDEYETNLRPNHGSKMSE
jgi:hypothetical protein